MDKEKCKVGINSTSKAKLGFFPQEMCKAKCGTDGRELGRGQRGPRGGETQLLDVVAVSAHVVNHVSLSGAPLSSPAGWE